MTLSAYRRRFAVVLLLCFSNAVVAAIDPARATFDNTRDLIYQIRVMDVSANTRSSTGSGFLIASDGSIATNYHVIASAISSPDKYRIEVLQDDEVMSYIGRIVHVDVVHDLAILSTDIDTDNFIPLATREPAKGDRVYSIGYPYDLGLTVVPGTYNGLIPHSASPRVHFTGSLNPGMSGGPAFNGDDEVIGVNVATSGNQISFLVPVSNLNDLIAEAATSPPDDLNRAIADQLAANSKRMINEMLEGNWETVPLGGAHALNEMTGFLRCWGNSRDEDKATDDRPFWAQRMCQTDHNIFVNRGFNTGKIELQFYWIESDTLNGAQFYNYYERIFSGYRPGNSGREQDLGNWACHENFVDNNAAMNTKGVFCARAYKDFEGIFDILFLQGSMNDKTEAHMIHFTLAGTTRDLAVQFTRRFMEAGTW
ncbi:MAG: hypothetical protein CMQ05_09695 [Gammaproteobacteria bacterium]|uniref:Serine protease n=1 Tax=OM182 bacterium MED-G24 TaxID=1986255 RepID=A0A2A5WY26_9GAMM|nr:hypothetical protein [Gammaproteobacteria bacterium]PDH40966.1 MAG: hypothetical protein CNE99_02485 [OM182 bacterium MED-G24]RPG26824.1 MAG: serine protease [Gammaproteobacteria bacterium TMED50]|tara:strand:- start:6476 stop:7750 length:1275 start_codon:yes stop_codon:yes gene_type:complete